MGVVRGSITPESDCYVAARIERERAEGEAEAGATVPAGVLFTRGREGRDGWLLREASNLIVAFCLILSNQCLQIFILLASIYKILYLRTKFYLRK